MSAIATANSGVDTYAAADAFPFYRLFVMTGDIHMRDAARLLLYNTKQAVNWDAAHPVQGYGDPGIMPEAFTLASSRGHGVAYFLPWQTANFLEPMVLFQDVFGTYDLTALDAMPKTGVESLQADYALNRGYEKSRASIGRPRLAGGRPFQVGNSRESISIGWMASIGQAVPIRIFDTKGKVVFSEIRKSKAGWNTWRIPKRAAFGANVYLLKVGAEGFAIPPLCE